MDEIQAFIDWLYDVSPVWPCACTREQLLTLYRAWLALEDDEAGEQAA